MQVVWSYDYPIDSIQQKTIASTLSQMTEKTTWHLDVESGDIEP